MEFSWVSAVFGAFGISVLKLGWDIIKYFIDRIDLRNNAEKAYKSRQSQIESLFNDLLEGSVQIQEHIESFQTKFNADRVLILKMENGGGIPQLGAIQHTSVLYEAYNRNTLSPVKADFQNYIIDSAYQKMLINTIGDKILSIHVDNMESGMLKTFYTSNAINSAIISSITHVPSIGEKVSKGFMIYMMVEFKRDIIFDSKLEIESKLICNKISQIFHKFYMERIMLFK